MEKIEVRPLLPADERGRFCSGNADLDRFFVKYAGQNQFRHHIGTTYVAVQEGAILGFITLSAAHIEIDRLPARDRRKLPHYPLPVLRLARLAVDRAAQGRGVGLTLLKAAFHVARQMAGQVGCVGVVVDAKPEAVSFYERYGFEALDTLQGMLGDRPEPTPMFLGLSEIPAA